MESDPEVISDVSATIAAAAAVLGRKWGSLDSGAREDLLGRIVLGTRVLAMLLPKVGESSAPISRNWLNKEAEDEVA